MNDFVKTADSRETSIELMEAILRVAGGNEAMAELIWDAPSGEQMTAIVEIVTNNGQLETTDFYWGASGTNWAQE